MTDISTYYFTQGVLGVTVLVLALVVVFLYRSKDKLQDRYNALQEQRIVDAKETRDKIVEPLEKQALMSEKIYEIVLNRKSR